MPADPAPGRPVVGLSRSRMLNRADAKAPGRAGSRAEQARIEQLYAIADRQAPPQDGGPEVVFCVDEFGPLNLQPRPGRQWAAGPRQGPRERYRT
jgi:hypothetical protein